MNLVDGWMDRTDDGHTAFQMGSSWNHILVGRWMSHATDIWMDLPCWQYHRQTSDLTDIWMDLV